MTYAARVVPTRAAALARLVARDFDPRKEAILEAAPSRVYPPPAAAPTATPARVNVPSPTRLDVEVELARPGILVVSETWYPGWRAWVDDTPAEILRADYLLRAVELDAGAHHVRFEYRPGSLRIGAALSLTGVAAAAGLAWRGRRTRTPAAASPIPEGPGFGHPMNRAGLGELLNARGPSLADAAHRLGHRSNQSGGRAR